MEIEVLRWHHPGLSGRGQKPMTRVLVRIRREDRWVEMEEELGVLQPCRRLDFGLGASRTGRESTSIVSSDSGCGGLLWQPQETNTLVKWRYLYSDPETLAAKPGNGSKQADSSTVVTACHLMSHNHPVGQLQVLAFQLHAVQWMHLLGWRTTHKSVYTAWFHSVEISETDKMKNFVEGCMFTW